METVQSMSIHDISEIGEMPIRPVLFTDATNDWGALEKWTNEYLHQVLAGKKFPIAVSETGTYPPYPEIGWKSSVYEELDGAEFFDMISSLDKSEVKYYLQTYLSRKDDVLVEVMKNLFKDVSAPEFLSHKTISSNLWIGTGGTITPLHYDYASNFLAQIRGKKRVILASPSSTSLLYPRGKESDCPHMSKVDLRNIDYERFPKVDEVHFYECLIEEGQMLYIPQFWWHDVHAVDESVTISVNFWWDSL